MMKKMARAVLVAVMAVFSTAVFAEDVDPCAGMPGALEKDTDGYYKIGTAEELYKFACMVNNGETSINGKLTEDICVNACGDGESVLKVDGTLSGTNFTQWTPIGTPSIPYKGTFDGNGHTISGLYFNDESKDNVGLFGRIGFGSTIQNVGVVDSYFEGDSFVGGVVGYNDTGHVEIVYNTGTVSGVSSVGGVVGRNEGIYVSQVYNVGVVKGKPSSQHTGGVVGYNGANSAVSDVYNTGAVSGGAGVGGVVGSNVGLVSNAYYNTDFYTGSAVGDSVSGVIEDAEGKTTAELASITLPSYWWYAGSGEEPDIKNGKLVYKLPGLKNVGSQPEIEYTGFQPNAEGYYEISTAQELKWFAQLVNSGATNINGRLTEDIVVNLIGGLMPLPDVVILFETNEDLSPENFEPLTPIGTSLMPYTGTFDGADSEGNAHVIGRLYFNDESADNVGLFGYIGEGAKIQNVGVVDSYIKGGNQVGGVVGHNDKGAVSNVYNTGTVGGENQVGGVVGENKGDLSNVYNTGTVGGKAHVGGVAGCNQGSIGNAYNSGIVNGNRQVGGVVGLNHKVDNNDDGLVNNVYNTGTVSGTDNVGGVVGDNGWTLTNSYNSGYVIGSGLYVGGVVGNNWREVDNSYYNKDFYTGEAFGENKGGEIDNVEGKTTAELASTTLPEGFSSENWKAGSGEEPDIKNGKLVYKLPGLKNVGSQPEIEYTGFQPNADGYYEISTAQELKWFAQLVNGGAINANGKLTANICLNACGEGDKPLLEQIAELEAQEKLLPESFEQWTPIGTESKPYTGIFDGAGFTISGLYFNDGNADYVGLFGNIYYGAKVQNVGVVDSYFVGRNSVGGVVGWNDGTVSNVYNTGAVSGENQVGGVVGENEGDLSNVYNTGVVSGTDNVGGVVGRNTGFVSYVYNTGSVSGSLYVGGVFGINSGLVSYVYYNTKVSCKNCSPIIGTFGKTTAELVAGTSLELDTDVWVLGGVGVNVKQDTLFYPYLKVMGPGAYVLSDVKKYTVTVAVNDETMGTVSGAGEYEYGAEVELSAVANEGYRFTDWEDDVKNAVRTITVTKNETYTANFEAIPSSSSEAESSSSEAESSSSEDESSSSEAESSSSEAESSSSEAKSSSSAAASSSSDAKSSSSSAKSSSSDAKSSSSSAKSSSSKAASSSSEAKSSSSAAASSSSDAKSSSSSAKSSSSDAKSSSSSAKSSSSAAASSSSDAKSSSSSAKSSSSDAKSSSSSAKSSSSEAESSSSEAKSSSSAATSSSSEAKSSSSSAKSSSSKAASSSSEAKSSSSAAASSSSDAESSSSEVGSSSSAATSSSSEAESSSSEAKSSSSDAKSSSSQKESVIARAALPQFSVTASGKMVSIAGARPNSVVNVFDMQGNLVKTVVTTAANLTFTLPSAGVYIVKNGYTAKRVNVR